MRRGWFLQEAQGGAAPAHAQPRGCRPDEATSSVPHSLPFTYLFLSVQSSGGRWLLWSVSNVQCSEASPVCPVVRMRTPTAAAVRVDLIMTVLQSDLKPLAFSSDSRCVWKFGGPRGGSSSFLHPSHSLVLSCLLRQFTPSLTHWLVHSLLPLTSALSHCGPRWGADRHPEFHPGSGELPTGKREPRREP